MPGKIKQTMNSLQLFVFSVHQFDIKTVLNIFEVFKGLLILANKLLAKTGKQYDGSLVQWPNFVLKKEDTFIER